MIFNSAYGERHPVLCDCSGYDSMTKQSFREDCDINRILAKYQRTGILEFVNDNEQRYSDVIGQDFAAAMQTVAVGNSMFEQLPSSVRARFHNRPMEFLEFVQDPANDAEAVRMGLKVAPVVSEPPVLPGASASPVGAPAQPEGGVV